MLRYDSLVGTGDVGVLQSYFVLLDVEEFAQVFLAKVRHERWFNFFLLQGIDIQSFEEGMREHLNKIILSSEPLLLVFG